MDKTNIKFLSNKCYPKSRMCYDFYLIDYDIFIELTGMGEDNYFKKRNILKTTNYKILWVNNLNELKNFINEENYKN